MEPIWGQVGANLGPMWSQFGPILGQVGAHWGQIRCHLGAMLGPKLGQFGANVEPIWGPIFIGHPTRKISDQESQIIPPGGLPHPRPPGLPRGAPPAQTPRTRRLRRQQVGPEWGDGGLRPPPPHCGGPCWRRRRQVRGVLGAEPPQEGRGIWGARTPRRDKLIYLVADFTDGVTNAL